MKTNIELLGGLEGDGRGQSMTLSEEAIANARRQYGERTPEDQTVKGALKNAFNWNYTPEGRHYWKKIHHEL